MMYIYMKYFSSYGEEGASLLPKKKQHLRTDSSQWSQTILLLLNCFKLVIMNNNVFNLFTMFFFFCYDILFKI